MGDDVMEHAYQNISLNSIEKEEWKDVSGYEGLYQVSNLGNVKRLPKWITNSVRPEIILKKCLDSDGYHIVQMTKNKQATTKKVHREVAKCFIQNPYNYPQVNHKDGVKTNNKVENLEWCTNLENQRHCWATMNNANRILKGESKVGSKLTQKQVIEIRLADPSINNVILAKRYNCSRSNISIIRSKKAWTHLG